MMKQTHHQWPRLARIDVLAAYCGVSTNTVKKDVKEKRIPPPLINEKGRVQWDLRQVDRWLDKLASGNAMKGWDDVGG